MAPEKNWHELYATKGLNFLPFKGKGQVAARAMGLRQGAAILVKEMESLVQATRSIRHKTFALGMVQAGGVKKLLWRLSLAKNGPRRVWCDQDFQEMLSKQPANMREWYGEVNSHALALNAQALCVHREIKLLEKLLVQIEKDERCTTVVQKTGR